MLTNYGVVRGAELILTLDGASMPLTICHMSAQLNHQHRKRHAWHLKPYCLIP